MKLGTGTLARIAVAGLLAGSLLPGTLAARTVKQKKLAARSFYETAEKLRDALEGTPEAERSRGDYQKVIEAYRKVYYTAPSSTKADSSVLAVAELLEDQGRVFSDSKGFKDAIGQLTFLRREYPGSKYRAEALFTIAEIYREDMNDSAEAKSTFEDFLKHYPENSNAPKARKALAEIANPASANSPFKAKLNRQKRGRPRNTESIADSVEANRPEPLAVPVDQPTQTAVAPAPQEPGPHRLPRLTSIRHWSTPDYTRVAIDLEQEVEYQSGRVPHPDRIFFDLHGTKVAPELVGKSFDVGSGFLHRIRVAQYKLGMARVVLDVDDVAEYSAFLLPNPYRLIIDIHGKLPPVQRAGKQPAKTPETTSSAAMADSAAAPSNDVTVSSVKKPAARPAQDGATAIQQAELSKAGLPKPGETSRAAESYPADRTTDASSAPSKVVVDDTSDADQEKVTKATTGPTFQSIAPKESSRKKKASETAQAPPASTARVAEPTASGERSLIRALGLKIGKIVVDAGHGGHDTGTIGPNGLTEKDLVLDVALKLGKLLEERLGADVVYTRDDDTFVPLETRTAIANKEQADLFISIHANSSSDASARGVETYYLNFTSRTDALEVAARENAVSEKSIHELQDLVKKIALKEKIGESREFATDVQRSLFTGLNARSPGLRNRGVKKAPFVVLIGANMPSVLAEISFVSNPGDEKKLRTNDYRQKIADSLYRGVARYVNSLSGIKVASRHGANRPESDASSSASLK